MSEYQCDECGFERDSELEGRNEHEGSQVCDDCYSSLTGCDHAWQRVQDIMGDGSDASYYQCAICDEQQYVGDL